MDRQRNCSKCKVELVNSTGVHMGIPFGKWSGRGSSSDPLTSVLVCAKCYDEVVIHMTQRTGEEII